MMRWIAAGVFVMVAMISDGAWSGATFPPDSDIHRILSDRIDVERQSLGIVVGLVEPQGHRIVAYGRFGKDDPRPVNGDTVFEIGSITKIFTSLLLADMVRRGEVELTDPIAKYLPDGVSVPQRGGRAITLLDLATHTSALPRLPDNLAPDNPANPYAGYSVAQLYQFLSHTQLTRDIGSHYEYSNLGYGLLGHALARRAGIDYEALVHDRIAAPLGMASTAITLSPEMTTRLPPGHDPALETAANWDLPTLAGAGALRSTARDLLAFLDMALERTPSPLSAALKATLQTRRPGGGPSIETGLGWVIMKGHGEDIVWHNGGTGGYRSFIGFLPASNIGVVVLSNTSTEIGVDDIGLHLLDPERPLVQPPKQRVAVAINPDLYDRYVGRYQLAPNFILTVTRDGNRLFAQATGQGKLEVFPEGDSDFFYKVVDAQLSFASGAAGHAASLTLHQNGRHMPASRLPD
jgi:serine-type D-Ala-D-Ala carboxypeptidase/endopeptidase